MVAVCTFFLEFVNTGYPVLLNFFLISLTVQHITINLPCSLGFRARNPKWGYLSVKLILKDFTYLKRMWMARIFFKLSVVSSYESSGS